MYLFPPTAAIIVFENGRAVSSYAAPYVSGGHVYAPVFPYLTRLARRVWLDRDVLHVVGETREVRVRLAPAAASTPLDHRYIALGTIARQLGDDVTYGAGVVRITVTRYVQVQTPQPYDPTQPTVQPRAVFTPDVSPTPRPVWTGSPLPRRTPLPAPSSPRPLRRFR